MALQLIEIKSHDGVVDTEKLAEARNEFSLRQCVLLKQVIEPALLSRLMQQVTNAPLRERVEGKSKGKIIASSLTVARDAVVVRAFTLLLNKPEIFRVVEQITDCPTINNFVGRIYMMRPGSEHYDSWHTDHDGNRLIGLSLNLSSEVYTGGEFHIRERESERELGKIANVVTGDAHIFRISRGLQHCVTPVTVEATKTAFAGWFCADS